ncbi:molybdenum cofactor guanylyltransferase [Paenibacillus wynnii]|uniref:molybdenum cofactor guanylyltransferase n=1 Tax=Paenibacillus wynnii TaxID=268407 RepID=UPI0027D911E5|nr:molybdenum cofactor guanylyltransferase [Paenibacillus wynnii]
MEISGILLAGGSSRRMGVNKALLEIGGVPLISNISSQLSAVADTVMISCSEKDKDSDTYIFLGLPLITDIYAGLGPLGGVHAGLSHSRTEWNAVIACDLPFVSKELLQHMRNIVGNADNSVQAVVPVAANGKVQPLLAMYHINVLPSLKEALDNRQSRVMEWLQGLNVLYIPEDEFPDSSMNQRDLLLNMNTPDDYRTVVQQVSTRQDGNSEP